MGKSCQFCFESETWKALFPTNENTVFLKKGFRQNDTKFLTILNELRQGHVSETTKSLLYEKVKQYHQSKSQNNMNSDNDNKNDVNSVLIKASSALSSALLPPTPIKTKVVPTVLYSINKNVDEINATALSRIKTKSNWYESIDEGDVFKLKDLRAPQTLGKSLLCTSTISYCIKYK